MGACCDSRTESAVSGQKAKNIGGLTSKTSQQAKVIEVPDDSAERARIEEIWKQFDTDGNGYLNRTEGYAFLKVELKSLTGSEPTEEELERNWNIIDDDANDVLDKEEVLKFLKGFGLGFTLKAMMRQHAEDQ